MFMTSKLTHVRNLFLNGNLDSFDFREGKLRVQVVYNTEPKTIKYQGQYTLKIDYNKCEVWHIGAYDDTNEVWECVERSLHRIEVILKDPKKALQTRMKQMPWVTKEQHLKTIKEICE